MKIAILVPTYNESGNIGILLEALRKVSDRFRDVNFNVVVLDDSSPDGTAALGRDVGQRLKSDNYSVTVMVREKKEGLGRAYIYGFKAVMNLEDAPDYVLQMDADLSHNPEYIDQFILAARDGADFVTATRYIDGGATPDWSWYRKVLSRGGNFYAKTILGRELTDYTGGFNMYGTKLLAQIDFDSLYSAGYGFLIDLKHRAAVKSRKIAQVPIVFHDRQHGNSKMPARTIIDSLFLVVKIRFVKNGR
jgi:dolichol-phosphate mannosyltransferase